jgi:hypothetical protein
MADWETEMEEWLICLASRGGLHAIRSFFTLEDGEVKEAP